MKTFLIRNNEGLAIANRYSSEIDWIVNNYPLPIFGVLTTYFDSKCYNKFMNGRLIKLDYENNIRTRLYYTHDVNNIPDDFIFKIKDLNNVVYGYWYDFGNELMEVVMDDGTLKN